MKLEAALTAIASLIVLWFALTRNAYSMGALVFVAMPLYAVSIVYFLQTVAHKVRQEFPERSDQRTSD